MREVWRPIPQFPIYECSTRGRIRRIGGAVVCQTINTTNNNQQINIRINRIMRTKTVAPLICSAFHGPRPEGHLAYHLDGNRANCTPKNLAWKTPSEAGHLSYERGRATPKHMPRMSDKQKRVIIKLHRRGWSQVRIGKKVKLGNTAICRFLKSEGLKANIFAPILKYRQQIEELLVLLVQHRQITVAKLRVLLGKPDMWIREGIWELENTKRVKVTRDLGRDGNIYEVLI